MKPDDDDPCEVGYGNPPKHSQFKKGQSGNAKGRPKGKPGAMTVVLRALSAKVMINENGRRRKVTKFEAALMQLANKAAGGDLRALNQVTALMRLAEEREKEEAPITTCLQDADRLVLQSLMQKFEATTKEKEEVEDETDTKRETD